MTEATVAEARDAALRFLSRCKSLTKEDHKDASMGFGNKRTAAVRRASMELTRALADLRR